MCIVDFGAGDFVLQHQAQSLAVDGAVILKKLKVLFDFRNMHLRLHHA